MIDVENLTKRYGQNTVVGGLTFTVRSGAVTGFLGPNGAGKSTTMRMMLGLTRPDAGSARIDGCAYHELRYPARHVGALLETSAPHRTLTAAHHLLWLARSNRIARRRVGEVLEMVGLTDAARQRTGTFSLGMGQRLGLAAALLGDPPVLVLDEPVNGLDAEGIRWLRELLRSMAAEGRTVLVSSHLMAEMSLVADHLIVVHHGRLLADTGMSDFIQRHGRTYVRVRTPDPHLLGRELERKGASPTTAPDGSLEVGGMSAAEINRLAAAGGFTLDELSTHTGSLRDGFTAQQAGLDGVLYGQLALIVFGVLVVTSEYGSGMMRVSLLAVPRRGRLYAAKMAVTAVAAAAVAIPVTVVSYSAIPYSSHAAHRTIESRHHRLRKRSCRARYADLGHQYFR